MNRSGQAYHAMHATRMPYGMAVCMHTHSQPCFGSSCCATHGSHMSARTPLLAGVLAGSGGAGQPSRCARGEHADAGCRAYGFACMHPPMLTARLRRSMCTCMCFRSHGRARREPACHWQRCQAPAHSPQGPLLISGAARHSASVSSHSHTDSDSGAHQIPSHDVPIWASSISGVLQCMGGCTRAVPPATCCCVARAGRW